MTSDVDNKKRKKKKGIHPSSAAYKSATQKFYFSDTILANPEMSGMYRLAFLVVIFTLSAIRSGDSQTVDPPGGEFCCYFISHLASPLIYWLRSQVSPQDQNMTKTNPFLPLTGLLRLVFFFRTTPYIYLVCDVFDFCNSLHQCLCKLLFAQLDAKCSALNYQFHLVLVTVLLNMGLLHAYT